VVNAGFTCPNRDGTKGTGGCTYCDNSAFNPSYCDPAEPLHEQIFRGIRFHAVRYRRAARFLVYFQPYSNTYAPLDRLRRLYEEALTYPGVSGIVIGTRPDCMDDSKLDYLEELATRVFVQVEYGVESCYDRTLKRINRGHGFEESRIMIEKTHQRGINTGAHFIFGLPGESKEYILSEAKTISSLPLDTVKFHQLQIIKGTAMELEYKQHPEQFTFFELPEYIDFFIRFLEQLNPDFVLERFAGEVPPRFLAGPGWGLIRNDQILVKFEKRLEELDTWQGRMYQDER